MALLSVSGVTKCAMTHGAERHGAARFRFDRDAQNQTILTSLMEGTEGR
jgi:hypothetical protein